MGCACRSLHRPGRAGSRRASGRSHRDDAGDAAARRTPPALPERPQQLPRLRAPDGAGPRARPRRDPAAADPAARTPSWWPSAGASTSAPTWRGLRERGLDVEEIEPGDGAPEATAEAMRAGRDVIHQATFVAGNWRGAADFLLKVREPVDLGPYSYEPADAKLATHPKPYVIFQLLFYAAMAGQIQGVAPERVHVVLGTDETRSFRPRDFQAYADRVQGRFFRTLQAYRKGAAAAVPVPRRALRLLRLVGALPRPPPRRRPPLARRRDHARAGDRARGGGRAARHRAGRRAGRRARCPGSPRPRSPGCASRRGCRCESRDSEVPLHERLPGARRPRLRAAAAAVARATCSSTSRATRTGAARAWSTCSARSPRTATSRCGRTTASRSAPRSSAGSTGSRRAWSAIPTCTSTTTTTTSRPR